MKRPLKKLIAFTTALASVMNISAFGASASYIAEQVGGDYGSVLETASGFIYNEDGSSESLTEGSTLIIIGNDGTKSEITLQEGIAGIYNYASTTMGEYNYISPTAAPFSFDYFDPAYRLTTESDVFIAAVSGYYQSSYKAALMNKEGKLISEAYDEIYYINGDYYEVCNIEWDSENYEWKYNYGVIASDGSVIIAPESNISGVYLLPNANGFLVYKNDEAYFTDLSGEVYMSALDVDGYFKDESGEYKKRYDAGITTMGSPTSVRTDFSLEQDYFAIETQKGYTLIDPDLKPINDKSYSSISRVNENHDFICALAKDDGTFTYDFINVDGRFVFEDCDNMFESYYYETYENEYTHEPDTRYVRCIKANKGGIDYIYNLENEHLIYGTNLRNDTKNHLFLTDSGSYTYVYDSHMNKLGEVKSTGVEIAGTLSGMGKYGYSSDADKYNFDDNIYIVKADNTITAYDSTFTKSSKVYSADENSYIQSYKVSDDCDVKVTVANNEDGSTEERRYFVDNDLNVYLADSSDAHRIYNVIAEGREITDLTGKLKYVLKDDEASIDSIVVKGADGKSKYYYVTSDENSTKFSVYDESFAPVNTDIEGTFDCVSFNSVSASYDRTAGMSSTYFKNVEVNGETVRKYGWFIIDKGVVLEPVYDSVSMVKKYNVGFGSEPDKNTPYKDVIVASRDNETLLLDASGKQLKSWDKEYSFVGGTAASYSTVITFNYRGETLAESSSVGYDVFSNSVVYTQEGKYDYVDTFYDGRAVAMKRSAESTGDDLWSDGGMLRCFITIDGDVLIPEAEHNIGYDNSCVDDHGKYVSYQYNCRLPIDALDAGFAQKNGNDMAMKAFEFEKQTDDTYKIKFLDTGLYIVSNGYSSWNLLFADGTKVFEEDVRKIGNYSYLQFINGLAYVKFGSNKVSIVDKNGKLLFEPADFSMTYDDEQFYIDTYGNDVFGVKYKDFNGRDRFNSFTEKYGYESAVKCGDLYVVSDGKNTGVVTSDNKVLIPLEYKDILHFTANQYSLTYVRPDIKEALSGSNYTDMIKTLSDGSKLVNMKTWDDTVRAFIISDDGSSAMGDVNGDDLIDSSDAAMVLKIYALKQSGKEPELTDAQRTVADYNNDGAIDSSDAALILKAYALAQAGQ